VKGRSKEKYKMKREKNMGKEKRFKRWKK